MFLKGNTTRGQFEARAWDEKQGQFAADGLVGDGMDQHIWDIKLEPLRKAPGTNQSGTCPGRGHVSMALGCIGLDHHTCYIRCLQCMYSMSPRNQKRSTGKVKGNSVGPGQGGGDIVDKTHRRGGGVAGGQYYARGEAKYF